MQTNNKQYTTTSRWRIVWFSIGLGVIYWFIDCFTDVYIFKEGTLISQIFSPLPHEFWMRSFTMALLVSLGILAQQIISSRKKVDNLIRESEQKHRMVLNNIDEIVYFVALSEDNSLDGKVQFVSEKIERMLGYRPEEFTHDQGLWFRLIHPNDIPVVVERTKDILRNKQIDTRVYRLRHRSTGEYIWVEDRVAPQIDYSGKVTGIFGLARDITERRQAEEALKESEESYRNLFDNAHDLIQSISPDGHIIYVNPAWLKTMGYTQEELRQISIFDILHPEHKTQCLNTLKNVLSAGSRDNIEAVFISKDGKLIHLEGNAIVRLVNGTAVACNGIFRDITERKQIEGALKESEEQYRLLFQYSPIGVFHYTKDMIVTECNKRFAEIVHLYPEQIRGLDLKTLKVENVQSALSAAIKGEKGFYEGLCLLSPVPTETFVTLLTAPHLDRQGDIRGGIGIVEDITERKKMEEQIFQINQDWEDTFNIITDMITVHDKDFNIIRYNTAAEKMLGLSFLNIKKEKCYQFYHGTECPPAGCPSCMTFKTGVPSTVELFEPHLNMFIEIRAIPRFDSEHNLIGLIHVVRDITEHKKFENHLRQSQKMEAVGQLAGGVAHDFNNIITAIIGYSSIMKMKAGEDEYFRGLIDNVLSASEKAANLVQSLLAFSRKQISNPEPVRINEIIRSIEKLLVIAAGEDIELKIELTEDLIVTGDIVQIEQVMMNLCTNARDAMPGRGTLTIKTGSAELTRDFITAHGYGEEGRYALISVSDTGVGMDENTRQRIFEPFFTTKEFGKGTGLGLSIVYGIIKQHKGYITCQSELGKGTTFNIYLPVVKAAMEERKIIEPAEPAGAARTILFAEDEEEFRNPMKQILESSGYNVIEAVDGADAVHKFTENNNIDLLLFDIIMPKMSGKEAYDRIRNIKPDVKALFISGYPADFTNKYGVMEEGMNSISKPVRPAALLKKIIEAFGNASGK